MREIEVKARLKDKKLFLQKASQKGIVFGPPVVQEDATYETKTPYDDPSWNIFRLRKQGDKTILTMKYKASTRSRDNHERETAVGDAEQAADMLERLGYSLGVRVRKQRQTAMYQGLELCLDEVDELGLFVEVEKLADEQSDVDTIQSQLWELLLGLGVDPKDRVHKGYDTLMHQLKLGLRR
jgi:adenylate cyclase class 2